MECDICLEPMDEVERRPKMLPCGHTFCIRCLNAQRSKTCAVDRRVFQGAPSDLPDNFIVLRLSARKAAPRFWCRDCGKEATEGCGESEHRVCSLKKMRAAERQPRLDALRRGEASLEDMQRVLCMSSPFVGVAMRECAARLKRDQDDMAAKRGRLQDAQLQSVADWEQALEAATPSVLSQRAGPLMSTLADATSSCSVALRGGGVAWSGVVDPKALVAKLLLFKLLCEGKLEPEGMPELEEVAAGPRWVEHTNEWSVEETAARMQVGCRVARGKDWEPDCVDDGVPPGPGTVDFVHSDTDVRVRWDGGATRWYRMGRDGMYQLKLQGKRAPSKSIVEELDKVLDLEDIIHQPELLEQALKRLGQVHTLVGISCALNPRTSKRMLQKVSPNAEVVGLDSPTEQHLEVVRAMPKLRELHVRLPNATQQQLKQVLQTPKLSRLEVHCPFEAPLPPPSAPLPAVGLKWLRVGVYPLATALALVRANADTLEELELVAASTEPYGCPDLAGELRRCAPKKLRRLVLLRETDLYVCRHDEKTCKEQKNTLEDLDVDGEAHCSECDKL